MATIFIWNNHMFHMSRHLWMGHASMSINDKEWPSSPDEVIDSYVSWLRFPTTRSHSGHQRGYPGANILTDILFEGYAPDHILYIRFDEASMNSMLNYWRAARTKNVKEHPGDWDLETSLSKKRLSSLSTLDKEILKRIGQPNSGPSHRLLFKNCATMVANVLKASAPPSEKTDHPSHFIWTPLHVKRFALALGGRPIRWFDFVDKILGKSLKLDEKQKFWISAIRKRKEGMGTSGAVSERPTVWDTPPTEVMR